MLHGGRNERFIVLVGADLCNRAVLWSDGGNLRVDGAGVSRSAAVALSKPCTYRNSYTRCKNGWIYAPDGFGCVQSELCPICDGEGEVKVTDQDSKPKRRRRPHGYEYYESFDVDIEVSYVKTWRVRAMNENHAKAIAEKRASQGRKIHSTWRLKKTTCQYKAVAVKQIVEASNE